MAKGARSITAPFFVAIRAKSEIRELVAAAFAASEPEVNVGAMFLSYKKANGTAIFSRRERKGWS